MAGWFLDATKQHLARPPSHNRRLIPFLFLRLSLHRRRRPARHEQRGARVDGRVGQQTVGAPHVGGGDAVADGDAGERVVARDLGESGERRRGVDWASKTNARRRGFPSSSPPLVSSPATEGNVRTTRKQREGARGVRSGWGRRQPFPRAVAPSRNATTLHARGRHTAPAPSPRSPPLPPQLDRQRT